MIVVIYLQLWRKYNEIGYSLQSIINIMYAFAPKKYSIVYQNPYAAFEELVVSGIKE